jgi:Fic family protein
MPVHYHSNKFPPTELDWNRIVPLIGPATLALGDFKGMLDAIPNPSILLAPLRDQEAVLSSKIEGTQVTLGEVLEYEADAGADKTRSSEKIDDIQEILNYRRALSFASQRLDDIPLCGRLLKESHAILMDSVRGKDKGAGKYRVLQNGIGTPGCTLETAKFLPIAPEQLEDGMALWERFTHDPFTDTLVQLALIHAEFEALHPFLDGNGRLGRMIIPLFLYEQKMLSYPAFFISEYLELNREAYYERLLAVSRDDDWTGWCVFFLEGMATQARENTRKARAIMQLYEDRKAWIIGETHSQYAVPALDFIFRQPIFRSDHFWKSAEIPDQTARHILRTIRDELLYEIRPSSGRRPAAYAYEELLQIAEGRKSF